MFSGNLRASCLERTLYCKRNTYRSVAVISSFRTDLRLEGIHDILRSCQRTSEQSLLSGKDHSLSTDMRHDRNHHSGQKARLSDMELRKVTAAKLRRYTFDCQYVSIDFNLRTEVSCDLDRSLIVPAWSIAAQMRCTGSEGSGNDRTLRETLRNRHGQHLRLRLSGRTWNELEIAIYRRTYLVHRPLARGSGFFLIERSICIWSSISEAIQTRLMSGLAHAEGNETSVGQCTDLLISMKLLLATPLIQGHYLLDIGLRMCRSHDLDHVSAMIHALLHDCLESLERICTLEIMVRPDEDGTVFMCGLTNSL